MPRLSEWLWRNWVALILAIVAVAVVLNCIFAPRGVRDLWMLRQRRLALQAQVRQVALQNAEFETNVQKLRSDQRYLERLVRSQLGFSRPGELVYRFASNPER
jgi:cell division protein FtsB